MNRSQYPDHALLEQPDRREIVCLTLASPAGEAQLALLALEPFHVYEAGGWLTLLFEGRPPELEAILERFSLQAGLSGPFARPASAAGCCRKAELALETGRRVAPGRALYAMDDYAEEALLAAAGRALAKKGFDAADFADARLLELRRQDEEKGTAYEESLWTYLRCGLNPRVAAERLGVHRNTLAYRMERAETLFSLNLKDMNACFELLFSLWLLRGFGTEGVRAAQGDFDPLAARDMLWNVLQCATEREPRGDFPCALLCAGVTSLTDEDRARLILRVGERLGERAALCWDEDALFAAVAPAFAAEAETAFAEEAAKVRCPVIASQGFPVRRLEKRMRLCRSALQLDAGGFVRLESVASTLFFMTIESCERLGFYLREDVIRVMDEDAQRGSSLSRSLYAYLLSFCDLKAAAQQIGIHRNTMEYQIRKIDALTGGKPDEKRRFLMLCTYKMLAIPEAGRGI